MFLDTDRAVIHPVPTTRFTMRSTRNCGVTHPSGFGRSDGRRAGDSIHVGSDLETGWAAIRLGPVGLAHGLRPFAEGECPERSRRAHLPKANALSDCKEPKGLFDLQTRPHPTPVDCVDPSPRSTTLRVDARSPPRHPHHPRYTGGMDAATSSSSSSHTVCLLLCADGSVYVGQTDGLRRRLRLHQLGKAAKHTRERLPVQLIYSEPHPDLSSARNREQQLNRWTRAKKLALTNGTLRPARSQLGLGKPPSPEPPESQPPKKHQHDGRRFRDSPRKNGLTWDRVIDPRFNPPPGVGAPDCGQSGPQFARPEQPTAEPGLRQCRERLP